MRGGTRMMMLSALPKERGPGESRRPMHLDHEVNPREKPEWEEQQQWERMNEPEMRRRYRRDSGGRFAMGGEPYVRDEPPRIGFRSHPPWPREPWPYDGYGDPPRMRDREPYEERNGRHLMATGSVWMAPGEQHREREKERYREVDEPMAMAWVKRMRAADGSQGPKFKPDQAEQLRTMHCPQCKKWEFFVALNMMYADYCEVAQKMGVDRPDYYACMARAFLEDEDASEHKLAKYMERIAK